MTNEKHCELMVKYMTKIGFVLEALKVPYNQAAADDLGNIVRECIDEAIISQYPYEIVKLAGKLDTTALGGSVFYQTDGYAGFAREEDRQKFYETILDTSQNTYYFADNGKLDQSLFES